MLDINNSIRKIEDKALYIEEKRREERARVMSVPENVRNVMDYIFGKTDDNYLSAVSKTYKDDRKDLDALIQSLSEKKNEYLGKKKTK
jgi:hypothetical protein